jgi:hypothetical protein
VPAWFSPSASETTLSERAFAMATKCLCKVQGTVSLHGSFYRAFKGACASLRYSDKLNVHSLRHTTAMRLAIKVRPAQVQDFMGHGSYKTGRSILTTLTSGLEVATEISLTTDERKFMLQKSLGLWFHVMAADGEGE